MSRPPKARPAVIGSTDARRTEPAGLHPRNRHQGRYDFQRLTACHAPLRAWLIRTPDGQPSLDFSQPLAVRCLNRALLQLHYGITHWDFPDGYLCPPIPGRADYVHGLADLLASCNGNAIPQGPGVVVLDIGVGASCIYPLLGQSEYGWRFLGVDNDPVALSSARAIVAANPSLGNTIGLRMQPGRDGIFTGLLESAERFDLSMCNPPFHASAAAAAQGTARKWQNLGKAVTARAGRDLNFGGRPSELSCSGGEAGFVRRMIDESCAVGGQVLWFTSLVSKASNLPAIRQRLRANGATDLRVVAMAQGQKRSRFVAWTFQDRAQREAWRQRWHAGQPVGCVSDGAVPSGAPVPSGDAVRPRRTRRA
jgi:23S rRNA (adenine1618-N6)-methyltransferase